MRYTFVNHLFDYYKQSNKDFKNHLVHLQSWYIWNIYKQLSSDILDKAQDLKYSDIEQNFRHHIMERLKEKIITKIPAEKETYNKKFIREVHFKIVSEPQHISDHFFFDNNQVDTNRQSNNMEFASNPDTQRQNDLSGSGVSSKTSIIETFIQA